MSTTFASALPGIAVIAFGLAHAVIVADTIPPHGLGSPLALTQRHQWYAVLPASAASMSAYAHVAVSRVQRFL